MRLIIIVVGEWITQHSHWTLVKRYVSQVSQIPLRHSQAQRRAHRPAFPRCDLIGFLKRPRPKIHHLSRELDIARSRVEPDHLAIHLVVRFKVLFRTFLAAVPGRICCGA